MPGSSSRSRRSRTVSLPSDALAHDAVGAAHLERALAALREVADERSPVVHVAASGRSPACTRAVSRSRSASAPFHCGARFSANAATPSAASSVCVVTVSIPWRYDERGVGVHLEHPVERVAAPAHDQRRLRRERPRPARRPPRRARRPARRGARTRCARPPRRRPAGRSSSARAPSSAASTAAAGTVIMYGHSPTLISGVPNTASSAATTRSHVHARPKPPASA